MKLAEALCARADLQKKIEQLRSRLECVVKIQEGDEPDERPEDLFAELHEATLQLEELIYRINRTNLQATHEGVSITKMQPCGAYLKWPGKKNRDIVVTKSSMSRRLIRQR